MMYERGGRWYSDFWHQGVRYRKSFGMISKKAALRKDAQFKAEVYDGRYHEKKRRILFRVFAKKYIKHIELHLKPNTVRRYKTSIEMLKKHFSNMLIGKIAPADVERYKRRRKAWFIDEHDGKELKPGTLNRDLRTLTNMMKKAVEWGYLQRNPLKGIDTLKEDNEGCMWALTMDEEQQLLEACDKRPQRRKKKYLKDLVLFALNTGMRQEEIFSLRWSKVFTKASYIRVTDTKTHEDRNVPINQTVMDVLKRRKRLGTEYVFTNSLGTRLTVLTNAYWTAVKKAGLVKEENGRKIRFRFHDCRHTFGSRLGMNGTDLKTIMEIMGHKTTKVAMHYQHPAPDHKLSAVCKLDAKTATAEIIDLEKAKKNRKIGT